MIGLKIFLINAISAPRATANKIASVPYKKGASLAKFTVNSAKRLNLF